VNPKGNPNRPPLPCGRPRGSKNKSTKAIKDAFHEAFYLLGGVPALMKWAKKYPTDFYRLAARLIPVQVAATVNLQRDAKELSDDELAAIVRREAPALPTPTQH
jgi:hypothetical protein